MTKKLIELALNITAQDEFTCSADSPIPIKQAYAIINDWRAKAEAALKEIQTYNDDVAKREGWALFLCDNGLVMIQRLDDPQSCGDDFPDEPVFDDDDAAIAFVQKRAAEGSAMHQDALNKNGKPEA